MIVHTFSGEEKSNFNKLKNAILNKPIMTVTVVFRYYFKGFVRFNPSLSGTESWRGTS